MQKQSIIMTVKVGINGSGRMGRLVGTLTSSVHWHIDYAFIYFCLIASLEVFFDTILADSINFTQCFISSNFR